MRHVLAVIATHPVQYHAPVFRAVARDHAIAVKVIYGSDFSAKEFHDPEFNRRFRWDVPLVTDEDDVTFLSTVGSGGARTSDQVSARGLNGVLRRLRPSAALVLGYQPMFYIHAIMATQRQRIPLLFRAETTDHARRRNPLKHVVRDAALRLIYSRCDHLLPIGERSRRHFVRLGVAPSKLIDSRYCVDTTPFQTDELTRERLREPTRRSLGVRPEQTVILFSGKLSPRKGPHLLLHAAAASQLSGDQVVVAFLGDGELKADLAGQAVALGVSARFLGFKNQTELSPYFHAADMLALPSIVGETWGLVVNEALHHGVPVVVSDSVGSALDLVEPGLTGEIAQAGSIDGLSSAIRRAYGLAGAECRSRCRAKIAAYSVGAAAAGIAAAFHSVTDTDPASAGGPGLTSPG